MTSCKQCNSKENLWKFDEVGKSDWTDDEISFFKSHSPLCEDCIKKLTDKK